MTDTERLRAVAIVYREHYQPTTETAALADLFDGIAERHTPVDVIRDGQSIEECALDMWLWPCPDVRAGLAVADALGIER
jgi:hypothetical protein